MYYNTVAIVTDTAQWYWCTVDTLSPCSPERWSVGGGEGRSSLGRQERVPADDIRGKEEEGGR